MMENKFIKNHRINKFIFFFLAISGFAWSIMIAYLYQSGKNHNIMYYFILGYPSKAYFLIMLLNKYIQNKVISISLRRWSIIFFVACFVFWVLPFTLIQLFKFSDTFEIDFILIDSSYLVIIILFIFFSIKYINNVI